MVQLGAWPAFWGGCGAFFVAGMRLSADLWGGEVAPDERGRKRALVRWLLANFLGPVAAAALTPSILAFIGKGATAPPIGLGIGMSCNAMWPLFINGFTGEVRKAIGAMFKRVGALLNGDTE